MATKYQPRADGEESTLMTRWLRSDHVVATDNRKAYRKRERKVCAFGGCDTPVRYRSVYAPYCDRHGTPDRRAAASEVAGLT